MSECSPSPAAEVSLLSGAAPSPAAQATQRPVLTLLLSRAGPGGSVPGRRRCDGLCLRSLMEASRSVLSRPLIAKGPCWPHLGETEASQQEPRRAWKWVLQPPPISADPRPWWGSPSRAGAERVSTGGDSSTGPVRAETVQAGQDPRCGGRGGSLCRHRTRGPHRRDRTPTMHIPTAITGLRRGRDPMRPDCSQNRGGISSEKGKHKHAQQVQELTCSRAEQ